MKNIILINKPLGITPLQAIKLFKQNHPAYLNQTISFAGRLDPMADGLLLLLIGAENKKRKEYELLNKTYEFSLLLGVATDTYDLMGKITEVSNDFSFDQVAMHLDSILPHLSGTVTLPYPPYSSKAVRGKPLYWYARENKLNEIQIPMKTVNISSLSLLSSTLLPRQTLYDRIDSIIPNIHGDFRQEKIVSLWQKASSSFPTHFQQFSLVMTSSSGTYVRQIVHEIGRELKIPTVSYSITRTGIGDFKVEDAIKLSA